MADVADADADADGVTIEAEVEACAEVVVVETFVAFDDDEVELVHPAAATQKSNMAHTATIAACFCFNVTPL